MTQNQIKNLGVSIFCVLVIGYALTLKYSLIGLAGAALASSGIILIALVYSKQQSIIEKIDLYILLSVLSVLVIQYDQLRHTFTMSLFTNSFDRSWQIVALIVGTVIGKIFIDVSKKRSLAAAKTINKYIGLFFIVWGISIFFLGDISLSVLSLFISIFSFFGIISYCHSNLNGYPKDNKRLTYISFSLATISLVLSSFFPMFRLSEFNLNAFLSMTLFPWYSVLGITLFLASITGMGLYYGNNIIDEDLVFLVGIGGLVWVIKASIYFYFAFHWISICIYVLIFFGFINRFIKRKKAGEHTALSVPLKNNEFYLIPIAAISVVFSIILINAGHIYFLLSLIFGLLVVLFVNKNATGWAKDAVFWGSLLLSISAAACMLSMQNGFSLKKITIIAALFVFTSIAMGMLNHNNLIGHNKFGTTKIAMVIVFALLVIIPAFKAGSNIDVAFEKEGVNEGALMKEASGLKITATADGKNDSIKKLSYVWSDVFRYEKESVVELDKTEATLKTENSHLILWAEDSNGVVTRKDCWFYDTARDDDYSDNGFRIGTND